MNQNQYFSTTSLSLAAAIQVSSASKLQFVDRTDNSDKAGFVFDRTEDLDRVVQLFWQRQLPLDALTYFEAIKYVKARLYEDMGGERR